MFDDDWEYNQCTRFTWTTNFTRRRSGAADEGFATVDEYVADVLQHDFDEETENLQSVA